MARGELAIYCVDTGSIPKGSFAWARVEHPGAEPDASIGGSDIYRLLDLMAADLAAGVTVALGFEHPLTVPVTVGPKPPSNPGGLRAPGYEVRDPGFPRGRMGSGIGYGARSRRVRRAARAILYNRYVL